MKFSVLIPTRDRLELLKAAVHSVLRQDYDDFEIVISDNCSSEPAEPWISSLGEPRIRLLVQESPVPVTENWNRALAASTGDYVLMLGDDDAICPGYFRSVLQLLEAHGEPDCIYQGAYLFTYPGVIPGRREGQMHESRNALFWRSGTSTYFLDSAIRRRLVQDALALKNSFGFNMQFALLKRSLLARLTTDGGFYHSPYPDYYAMNLVMLEAERVLVHEPPLVCIGVSPKSFGWYFLNSQENSGNAHLGISGDGLEAVGLDVDDFLPGTSMNTHWLMSMAMLRQRLGPASTLPQPSIGNYRRKQIIYFCILIAGGRVSGADRRAFRKALGRREGLLFALLGTLARLGSPGRAVLMKLHVLSEKTPLYVFRMLSRRLRFPGKRYVVQPGQGILDGPKIVASKASG